MFTVLEIEPRTHHCRRCLFRGSSQPLLTRVAVKSGAPFFRLRLRADPAHVPWDAVFAAAGRCACKLLTAAPVELPKNDRVRLFVPQYLPLCVALNTLTDILSAAHLLPCRLRIGVHDPHNALCGKVGVLLPFASDVRIVTTDPEAYNAYSQTLCCQVGAGLTVDTRTTLLADCDLLLCPNASVLPDSPAVRFACASSPDCFRLYGVSLPAPYDSLLPIGIEPTVFAAALYELCGVQSLGMLKCGCLAPDGSPCTVDAAAGLLRSALHAFCSA